MSGQTKMRRLRLDIRDRADWHPPEDQGSVLADHADRRGYPPRMAHQHRQRKAYARIAHVICETYARLDAVGLTQDSSCDFPSNPGQAWRGDRSLGGARQSHPKGAEGRRNDPTA